MSAAEAPAMVVASLPNGWQVGRFGALGADAALAHAVTTRRGLDPAFLKDSRDAAAGRLAEALGLDAAAWCRQVHGAEVLRVAGPGPAGEADGLVTDAPALGVMCVAADCPLILAADTAGPAVGVAHASWRGTVRQVATRLIEALRRHFGVRAEDVVACICPSAGPCCYEVGGEVLDEAVGMLGLPAERFFRARPEGKFLFDLWAANRDQLLRAGLLRRNVYTAGVCTICHNDLYPSYRVEGPAAGRLAAIIGRPAPPGAEAG